MPVDNVEEDLARQRALDEAQQLERMRIEQARQQAQAEAEQQQSKQGRAKQFVKNAAKQAAKQAIKKYGKKVLGAAAKRGLAAAAAATSGFWGPAAVVVAIIVGLLALGFLIFTLLVYYCNAPGLKGTAARGYSFVASWLSGGPNVCKTLKISMPGQQGPQYLVDIPKQYVSIANFGYGKADFPRVKPVVEYMIEQVFAEAAQKKLKIVVTSALRDPSKYAYSCHVLGEAVDFVLLSPASDANIDQLLAIGRDVGWGTVLDEYRKPSEKATGPHVHMGLTSDPNCVGRQTEIPDASEFYMPYQ